MLSKKEIKLLEQTVNEAVAFINGLKKTNAELKARNSEIKSSRSELLNRIEKLKAENALLKDNLESKRNLIKLLDASARRWEKQATENGYHKDNYARLVDAAEQCFIQLKDMESRTPELEHMYHVLRVTLIKTGDGKTA